MHVLTVPTTDEILIDGADPLNTKSQASKDSSPDDSISSSADVNVGLPPTPLDAHCSKQSAAPVDPQLTHPLFNILPLPLPIDSAMDAELPLDNINGQETASFSSSTTNSMFDDGSTLDSINTTSSDFSCDPSPQMEDMLLCRADAFGLPASYHEVPTQQNILYELDERFSEAEEMFDFDNDVEDIPRPSDPTEEWAMQIPWPAASFQSSSSGEPTQIPLGSPYQYPRLNASSQELLLLQFDQHTCGILSVKDGPNENPWRTMIWPLAQDSPALYHAIIAMAAFHLSKTQRSVRIEGVNQFYRGVKHLNSDLHTMRTDAALATTLSLAFTESWDDEISTGITHLRGARALVNQALAKHDSKTTSPEELNRLQFLCNTWVYMDVIARLTSVEDDDSSDFENVVNLSWGPALRNTAVDPLMGCASTLFPLIGRVANLVRKVMKSPQNSLDICQQATDVKGDLENWEPLGVFQRPEDPNSPINDSLNTAEAYRWATLLYLHQAVPEIPSQTADKLAERVLVYLMRVPLTSRAVIIQIYPLFAAGCEVTGNEDRAWVEDRWTMMAQRMRIGNIDRCWDVVKEVWKRRDTHEMEKIWQKHRRAPMDFSNGRGLLVGERSTWMSNKVVTFESADSYQNKDGVRQGRMSPASTIQRHRRRSFIDDVEKLEHEKTVKGRLHWVGVMKDWRWEVLLG